MIISTIEQSAIDFYTENVNYVSGFGLINLERDNRTFTWGSNNRKLLVTPFDENPFSALASWFKTDEGVEVYQLIEKKFK